MSKKQTILFIVNPISGFSNKENIPQLLKDNLDHSKFDFQLIETQSKGHATEIANKAVKDKTEIIVACGGDGTVNEVAKSIVHTDSILGILPNGSGNGFAMHIGMGRNSKKAIHKINTAHIKTIDTCTVNEEFFLNLAGIGFDALIAHRAESGKKRGFQMYIGMISKELIKFKAEDYTVQTDNEKIQGPYSVIAVANAAMYGYNFTIAPLAELTDGLLDVVFVKKAPLIRTIGASWRLLNNSLYKSPLVEIKKTKEVIISIDKPYYYHIDGESFEFNEDLHFKVVPKSLKVLFPEDKIHMN